MEELHANRWYCYKDRDSSILVFTKSCSVNIYLSLWWSWRASSVCGQNLQWGAEEGTSVSMRVTDAADASQWEKLFVKPTERCSAFHWDHFISPESLATLFFLLQHPSGENAKTGACQVSKTVDVQHQVTENSPVYILAVFNQCRLEWASAGFYSHGKCYSRNDKILHRCYGNVKDAHRSKTVSPLSTSDDSTAFLMPKYKIVLKCSKSNKSLSCRVLRTVWRPSDTDCHEPTGIFSINWSLMRQYSQ